jgi:hypothetical protein
VQRECNIRLLLLFSGILACCGLFGCNRGGDFAGLKKHWMSGGYHNLVVERNGIVVEVVPADVKWVKVRKHMVYGFIDSYAYSDGVSSRTGHFVYNTILNVLVDGISKERQEQLLEDELK